MKGKMFKKNYEEKKMSLVQKTDKAGAMSRPSGRVFESSPTGSNEMRLMFCLRRMIGKDFE